MLAVLKCIVRFQYSVALSGCVYYIVHSYLVIVKLLPPYALQQWPISCLNECCIGMLVVRAWDPPNYSHARWCQHSQAAAAPHRSAADPRFCIITAAIT